MRVIAFIEQAGVIRKILKHLGLWGNRRKPEPRANAPPVLCVVEHVGGYLPTPDDNMVDPFYPVDTYFFVFCGATQVFARKSVSHAARSEISA
jgi:hypothetical protein